MLSAVEKTTHVQAEMPNFKDLSWISKMKYECEKRHWEVEEIMMNHDTLNFSRSFVSEDVF